MAGTSQKNLLDVLTENGVLNPEQKAKLQKESEKKEKTVEELLLQNKAADAEQIAEAKAAMLGLPYASLVGKEIDSKVLAVIPKNVAKNYHMAAYEKSGDHVKVGLTDPLNIQAMEAMDFLAGENHLKVSYTVFSEESFKEALKKYESIGREVEKVLGAAKEKFAPLTETKTLEEIPEGAELEEVIKRAPVAQIVSVVIKHAVDSGASDIHIEPGRDETRVRYRIDGVLHTTLKLPMYIHSAVTARIKVLANLRLDETRVPQDGRIRLRVSDHDVDFRVSTIPNVENEKIVMRILETRAKALALADLGFHPWVIEVVGRNIAKANGMFLVTGPTGSGKSTTLYTVLNMLNNDSVNIATLEDPVEYFIRGVNQSQVNPEVGFTFSTGLRALLRQDPNIIMVGEIRDTETGELAIHAGLTGHLIFSTIHTRDSFGVVPRLIDMKLEPFLIASTLNAVVAQRLVRKICEYCKEKDESVPDDLREKFKKQLADMPEKIELPGVDFSKDFVFYKGKGCLRCNNSGYKGRSVVSEALEITRRMQQIIGEGLTETAVRDEAKKQGMVPLMLDAFLKALEGITTVDEVLRVAQE